MENKIELKEVTEMVDGNPYIVYWVYRNDIAYEKFYWDELENAKKCARLLRQKNVTIKNIDF